MHKNHWISSRDTEFASWKCAFPDQKMSTKEEIWPFVKGILEIGEQEEVYRVVETYSHIGFKATSDRNYVEHLEEFFQNHEQLPMWEKILSGYPYRHPKKGAFCAQARLSYYEVDGTLKEAMVDDVGMLLKRLRAGVLEDDDSRSFIERHFMSTNNPIRLSGSQGWHRDDGEFDTGYLYINLYTNIWFPTVTGYLEDFDRPNREKPFDNSELAQLHTPRLNRFLNRLRDLTLELGGIWSLVGDSPEEDEESRAAGCLTLAECGITKDGIETDLATLPELAKRLS